MAASMDTKDKGPGKEPAGGNAPVKTQSSSTVARPAATPIDLVIAKERNALPAEARQFLDAHLIANPSHALNERCFRHTHTFKPMTIIFNGLRANSKAYLSLQADQEAIWSDGGEGDRLVGLALSSRIDPVLYVQNFLVNAREMYVQTYQDSHDIQIDLYLRTEQRGIRGRVDLPPGASVTLQSENDRSTVIGLSSFAIELD